MGTLDLSHRSLLTPNASLQASVRATLRTTAHLLVAPVQAVVGFFAPWHNAPSAQTHHTATKSIANNVVVTAVTSKKANPAQPPAPCHRRVRVLRVMEAGCTAHSAGRMMISGRFSEVCAELDRLTLQEAHQETT